MPEYSAPGRSAGFACGAGAGSDAGGFSWARAIVHHNATQLANRITRRFVRITDVNVAVMVLHGYGAYVSDTTVHSAADEPRPSAIIDPPLCRSNVVE
jgi:hypothetical protein